MAADFAVRGGIHHADVPTARLDTPVCVLEGCSLSRGDLLDQAVEVVIRNLSTAE